MRHEATHGTVLVLDDKYAVVDNSEYSRPDFEKNVASLPFRFEFASGWDEARACYTVAAAIRAVEK
jgi:hypothetical protein